MAARATRSDDLSATELMQIGFRTIDGVTICYAHSGEPSEQSIVLTSPWPESVYAFAPIWPLLERSARLVAVDLPGFGASEGREDLLCPSAMGEFLVRLIEDFGLCSPHVVAPDVGTSAALFAASSHLGLLSSVIVGSGATAVPIQLHGPLRDWVLGPVERWRAMDARSIVGATLDRIEGNALAPEIREDYLKSYEGDRFVESMRYVRSYPEELAKLTRQLSRIETPVLIIAGRRDRVVPLANAEFLDERLPNSRLATVDAGHFVWEEAAGEYGSLIAEWIRQTSS